MDEVPLLTRVCCDIGIADPDTTLKANPGLSIGHVLKMDISLATVTVEQNPDAGRPKLVYDVNRIEIEKWLAHPMRRESTIDVVNGKCAECNPVTTQYHMKNKGKSGPARPREVN
jgi:hypothetical protein